MSVDVAATSDSEGHDGPPAGRPRVLLLETIHDDALAELAAEAEIIEAWGSGDDELLELARNAPVHAIVTRGKGRVNAALLECCVGLVAVARCGVGLDNIDCAAAAARGAAVVNLPGCNARTIAEHTLMLMLAVQRGLVDIAVAVRDGRWHERSAYDHDELGGRTVGIVGMGHVGRRVAPLCAEFGMRVVYCDPAAGVGDPAFERVELGVLLERSDVVTLHCPLDESTRGLIDAAALARMRRGALLINTARGRLVDHDALVAALRSGHLGGYGADVLDVEPPPADHPLPGLPNVVLTPHVGSLTRSTYQAICVDSIRKLLAALREAGFTA